MTASPPPRQQIEVGILTEGSRTRHSKRPSRPVDNLSEPGYPGRVRYSAGSQATTSRAFPQKFWIQTPIATVLVWV